MTTQLASWHIEWAKLHDWFVCDNGDGTITVADRWVGADSDYHEEHVRWTESFPALRCWAGY